MVSTCVNVDGLSGWYTEKNLVIDRASFQLDEASTMGLLGGNGVGKTTLFMALADIIEGKWCDSLKVNGRKMTLSSVTFKKLRFLVFQVIVVSPRER